MSDTASATLRASIREMIRDSGLKQVFIAERLGITPKHMSQLVLGKAEMTLDWAAKIADVCRRPLRLDIEPMDWARDVVTWRERAEQAEATIERVRELANHPSSSHGRVMNYVQAADVLATLDQPEENR